MNQNEAKRASKNHCSIVNDTLSGVTQYYWTAGNFWDSPYSKHQLRDSTSL